MPHRALQRLEEFRRRIGRHGADDPARHQKTERVDGIGGVGHQHYVARRGDRLRHVGEAFLRAQRGDDLRRDGGVDGLDAYRALAPQILRVLRDGGRFAVEIGPGQSEPVQAMFRDAGAHGLRVVADLAGRDRVIAGAKATRGSRNSLDKRD